MRRTNSDPLLFDPEIERTIRRRRAHQRLVQATMANNGGDGRGPNAEEEARINAAVEERLARRVQEEIERNANRSLRDHTSASMTYDYPGSIVHTNEAGVQFELRPNFINLVNQSQFGGASLEDPHAHLERFIRNRNTCRIHNVSAEAIRLAAFPFSLRDAAEELLGSPPQGSITTWDDLAENFTTKFMPPALLRKKINEIMAFAESESENLHEAWERFKKLLRKCPQHNLTLAEQVTKFYDGLLYSVRSSLDAAANGEFDAKSPQEGKELIEKMAARAVNSVSDRQVRNSAFEIEAVGQIMSTTQQLAKQMSEIQRQLKGNNSQYYQKPSDSDCTTCGSPYCGEFCSETATEEEVKAMGLSRNDPYSNNYNQGWRNHPNFSWRDRDQGNNANSGQGGNNYQKNYQNQRPQGQGFRQQPTQEQGSGSGSKKNLEEILEGFMAKQDAMQKEHQASIKNLENQMGEMAKQLSERDPGTLSSDTQVPRNETANAVVTRSGKVLNEIENIPSDPKLNKVPFPRALVKKNLEKQFSKFMEVFKKLQINIPFAEALEQMPTYAKFMKDILSRRRKLRDLDETILMTENCSAILQRKLPQKVKDLGSFTIPVDIEGSSISEALCDLGASINLMPLTMFRRLNLVEVTPTMISLQMADRTIKAPNGICEDVLVRVDKFVFPVDFVILDMEEDERVPLILGRPFLATGRALIDVEQGVVDLRVADDVVTFNVYKNAKHPGNGDEVFICEIVENLVCEEFARISRKDPLEAVIMDGINIDELDIDSEPDRK